MPAEGSEGSAGVAPPHGGQQYHEPFEEGNAILSVGRLVSGPADLVHR